jgi:phosphoribosyl 1,2-cyclic phosphodiesterase
MDNESNFYVRFWGVRGSIAAPAADTLRYGGNTSSLEIRCGDRILLFDAGTGIRYLGRQLSAQGPVDADLFFTHTHFDHTCGLPFFTPFFDASNRFNFYSGHLLPEYNLKHVLSEMMISPLFPVPLGIFRAELRFNDFCAGDTLKPRPGIVVRTAPLNHPDRATGYRVDYQGRSICYLTDTEHFADRLDANILELIRGADIVIYDSMYTDEEYTGRQGWGHSTWAEGAKLCAAAGAKTFVVFHHDPDHDDDFMDGIARDVALARPGSVVAREGLLLRP